MHYWKRQKKKKKKITDVWITAFIGFMASTEQVFQVHIHQRPQWSLWVYKEKYSPIVKLKTHKVHQAWTHGKVPLRPYRRDLPCITLDTCKTGISLTYSLLIVSGEEEMVTAPQEADLWKGPCVDPSTVACSSQKKMSHPRNYSCSYYLIRTILQGSLTETKGTPQSSLNSFYLSAFSLKESLPLLFNQQQSSSHSLVGRSSILVRIYNS